MNFEKKLKEIEDISAKLQSEQTGIDEGIALFEKSVEITKECLQEIGSCKNKIDMLKQELDKLLSNAEG